MYKQESHRTPHENQETATLLARLSYVDVWGIHQLEANIYSLVTVPDHSIGTFHHLPSHQVLECLAPPEDVSDAPGPVPGSILKLIPCTAVQRLRLLQGERHLGDAACLTLLQAKKKREAPSDGDGGAKSSRRKKVKYMEDEGVIS